MRRRRRWSELHVDVQLRRLPDRHRQPARVQPALLQHRRPLPLRHDLLPPPHGTLLRRPPRRRLPRCVPSIADIFLSGDVPANLILLLVAAAQAFGLPLLQPYLSRGKDVRQGVNFAVGGATAMDPPFFEGIGASDKLWTNLSLSVQLDWFEKLKPLLCSSPKNCKKYFSRSLFLVGEIGGNDYNYAFFKGKTLDDAKSYVPTVSSAIIDATERLIKGGAMHLVVPGNLPMGCSSAYLTLHPGRSRGDYDAVGCLKTYNDFAQRHNAMVQQKLQVLRLKYPEARIMYADYYGAAMAFAKNPKQFGFKQGPLKTCCGGGGPYNFNPKASCGVRGSSVCADPSAYANWDGVHLTEAAYHAIADSILHGPYTSPRLL
uniref:GDSL esterase/lipase n=1 Tax=Aegilops tauschii subsp. strangulata TaxID=200361 RepID=A0A453EE91_AEGTS